MTTSYFNAKGHPLVPGAYMIRYSDFTIPIYTSINNYDSIYTFQARTDNTYNGFTLNNNDSMYCVMPGFKLSVYNYSGYGTLVATGDASSRKVPLLINSTYTGSSCILEYYNSATGTMITINEPS
jgi:hypothetical protein